MLLRSISVAVLLACAGCGSHDESATDVAVALSFAPAPHVGDTVCTVHLNDLAGAAHTGATLELEGNMNHAGMVPVFADAVEAAPGVYEAPFEFTMGGDWFVIVRGVLADGREFESVQDVPGVSADSASEATAACECCTARVP